MGLYKEKDAVSNCIRAMNDVRKITNTYGYILFCVINRWRKRATHLSTLGRDISYNISIWENINIKGKYFLKEVLKKKESIASLEIINY